VIKAEPVLELNDATVVKDGLRILDGLTLTIRAGEHTAIVGPNGAGKTTLLNVLTEQDHPLAREEGEPPVRIFGRAMWDIFDLRSRLGIVTSDLHQRFVDGNHAGRITAEHAVLSGFHATHGVIRDGSVTDAMRQESSNALRRLEVDHLARKTLDEMSTGEARRVLIARALVSRPDALVLDEPTAGLDLVARARFLNAVSRIARGGTTIILVTHHVEEIIPEIDHLILIKRGRVACAGPKRTILTDGNLSALFDAPVAVHEAGGYYHARAVTA
jgi:iron complex transport system ATP-binding protein